MAKLYVLQVTIPHGNDKFWARVEDATLSAGITMIEDAVYEALFLNGFQVGDDLRVEFIDTIEEAE